MKIIQSTNDLPELTINSEFYLDFETTSGSVDLDSLNPWHHCDVLGIAVTTDTCNDNDAWYIPVKHQFATPIYPNIPVNDWIKSFFSIAKDKVWVNHNVKYDAHVLKNCFGIEPCKKLYDTIVQCKLLNSDLISYDLGAVSKFFLDLDISVYENKFKHFLFRNGRRVNSDYGVIPADILGPYACTDVIAVRLLKQFLNKHVSGVVSNNEFELTRVLYDMERVGMRVDPQQVSIKSTITQIQMIALLTEIGDEEFRPHVNSDCYELLCCRYGLPVLEYTESRNPSFDKDALKAYRVHPRVLQDKQLLRIIECIEEYRKLHTFDSLFLATFLREHIDGVLHPSYNQCVRTGRLSCSRPNAQQLNELAKELILPIDDNHNICDIDLSQIEFRLIGSTLKNRAIISAYKEDPLTDYHQLIANLAGVGRKPAKNLNFAVAFGSGRKKTIQMLKASLDLAGSNYDSERFDFSTYCELRANKLYDEYHDILPELKEVSKLAESIVRRHGFINNMYGRRRVLPCNHAYRAFNTYIQSTAADIAKSITLRICKELDVKLFGVVHDSWIFYIPKEDTERVCKEIVRIVESEVPPPPKEFLIPIRCNVSVSDKNWGECK